MLSHPTDHPPREEHHRSRRRACRYLIIGIQVGVTIGFTHKLVFLTASEGIPRLQGYSGGSARWRDGLGRDRAAPRLGTKGKRTFPKSSIQRRIPGGGQDRQVAQQHLSVPHISGPPQAPAIIGPEGFDESSRPKTAARHWSGFTPTHGVARAGGRLQYALGL